MAYLVVAYPQLSSVDFEKIQSCRKDFDERYFSVINPHFTLVFPVHDFSEIDFVKEIKEQSKEISKFDFVIRCATVNKDAFSDYYHTFLVPDEGYSRIVKLHDTLYSNQLQRNLRLDIDFIPHIGIGNSNDKNSCKNLAAEWNKKEFAIAGTVNQLTILNYENGAIEKIDEVELK